MSGSIEILMERHVDQIIRRKCQLSDVLPCRSQAARGPRTPATGCIGAAACVVGASAAQGAGLLHVRVMARQRHLFAMGCRDVAQLLKRRPRK